MMKRILLAGLAVLALAGCDSKPGAPFGLKWGQSMDSISFIKDGECEKEDGITTCIFDNQRPFNEWSHSNKLKFDRDGLVEVESSLIGVEEYNPSFDNFKKKLNSELLYLKSNGLNESITVAIINKCEEESTCNEISETGEADIGKVDLWILRPPSSDITVMTTTITK